MRVITTLENLLSISATRFKVADEDFRARSLNSRAVRAATARAYADVAMAIAVHKHAVADAADAENAVALLRDAETAELVAHNAADRARRLGAY
jgi:hypothetical protein